MSELRDRARMIAKGAAAVNLPKYYCADFEPHDWVVDAVTAALSESTADLVTVVRELRALRLSDADRQALEWLAGSMREYVAECAQLGIAFDMRHSIALSVLARLAGGK